MDGNDVDDWLRDTEVEPPCGPNLEYDDAFLALASASAGKREQQYGDTIIPGEDPDWAGVVEQATQLLRRSKDLRAATLLARGLTHVAGIGGLAAGLECVRGLLERHWDDVHPKLVYDGEADPLLRASALAALADPNGLVRDLRAATLFATAAGPVTVRAAEATLKHEATSDNGVTEAQLAQAAAAGIGDPSAPIASMRAALDHAEAIASNVAQHFDAVDAPDLAPLLDVMKTIARIVPKANGAAGIAATAAAAQDAVSGEAMAAPGALRTRADALRMLDAICEFLERTEPSSPAPLLIRRAQRLIGSHFIDIMRDMAPESVAHIELITGALPARSEE
jgi:type VI secretion system protein ImpA